MEYDTECLLCSGDPSPWSDEDEFQRYLDANNYIPNANMGELRAKFQAEQDEYEKDRERRADMGFALDDLPCDFFPEFESESESESDFDFNKCAIQEEASMEAKKDPSQLDSHDVSTEEEGEGCSLASRE